MVNIGHKSVILGKLYSIRPALAKGTQSLSTSCNKYKKLNYQIYLLSLLWSKAKTQYKKPMKGNYISSSTSSFSSSNIFKTMIELVYFQLFNPRQAITHNHWKFSKIDGIDAMNVHL